MAGRKKLRDLHAEYYVDIKQKQFGIILMSWGSQDKKMNETQKYKRQFLNEFWYEQGGL